jgi:hypothetical protein
LIVARKSKPDAAGSEITRKTKTTAKPANVKARKAPSPKKRAVEKAPAAPAPIVLVEFNPTSDQIQMRAYFISERRRRFDLPGDANSDWLEAKRQLLAETRS